MLNIDPEELKVEPFPYLVQRELFDPDVYAELKATYPRFDAVAGWRRMSKDLMRGDAGFAEAVSRGAWKQFFDYLNSPVFVFTMIGLFQEGLQSDDFLADSRALRLIDYIETREWIASNRVGKSIAEFEGPLDEVFVRMDFGIGELGYKRPPHLDWRHRVCSLLVYFDDPEETRMEGGRFIVHGSAVSGHRTVAVVEPENNLGILKLDNNRALHSVNEVTAINGQRKTLYIGVSSRGRVWRSRDTH
jgi:hypothetical protein